MRIKAKAIIGFVTTTLFVMLLMWGWGYISLLNSDMYKFSKEYVERSPRLTEKFGNVESVSLGFFNFKRKYAAGAWTGSFDMSVSGSKSKGKVYISVQSSDTGWQILSEEVAVEK
ncbi:hypothetical protein D3C87_175520 [compost metagenome]